MTGEKNLEALLAGLHPVQRDGEYVYVLWPYGRALVEGIEAAVREAEGLTVVLPRAVADKEGLSYDFVGAWITLEVHSALEAVGLTAAVSKALTEARISCNVLAGFHHDHLLVPVADAPRALEVLAGLSAQSRQAPTQTPPELVLRGETPSDRDAILALTADAFAVSPVTGLPVEGEPVEVRVLRGLFESEEYLPEFSVVAVQDGEVVGHVISTRGWVGEHPLLGLGPLAVTPRLQRHGIGSALMKETIGRANAAGESGIALLGSPAYYSRFGFVPASSLGVLPPEESWGGHFQLLPLALWPGGIHGTFRYAAPFSLV
ncbi:GNAT family N-acetyltransferase [Arthrobacter sp. BB-1]|uniref:N-acetyltransferase n=1 Tax=Micrococcaceae TaxID=1268 RepID=UPI00111280F4|nr:MULTISPECIES: N-acetyltransferase [Micrococcaceae]TNB73660.1 GNAT family N-acetyltransferase [Arthrobacter sp. BB-1]UEL29601.1 GNAT family N-acetyltransferase [Pseudarthrobacter sp. L1SW]